MTAHPASASGGEIIIPLIKPGIAALAIFSFITGWSNYLIASTFTIGTKSVNLARLSKSILWRYLSGKLEYGGGSGFVYNDSGDDFLYLHAGIVVEYLWVAERKVERRAYYVASATRNT